MSITADSVENNNSFDVWGDDEDLNINELGKILDNPLPKEAFEKLRTNEQYLGFNNNAGATWMYPSNLPLRAYQFSITKAALFKNTLVVLPTGLGKTFIAAVVMYNIYRWYPTGKVIFMAPTRPLVAQQIEACKKIMPFPLEDTMELTGKLKSEKRMACWREKRVFFATPQALQADIISQNEAIPDFPFQQVKLIVIDEAHRAKGRYAYVQVAQALHQHNKYFRVLALSATPGRSIDDVAEVIRNLFISHLEVRWDTSIDVCRYIQRRSIKTIVVHYGEEIKRVYEQMVRIIDPYLRQLIDAGVLSSSHQNLTRNILIMEQKKFRERQQGHPQMSAILSNFSICISLYHALELLERHGLRVFLNSFEDDEDGRPKFVLAMNPSLGELVEQLRNELGPNPFDVSTHNMTNGSMPEIPKNLDFGHPKFEEARKCILAHFEKNPDSRAIVFCEYRESVMMMYRLLLQHLPVLKPKCFVGRGGSSGSLRALSQKDQIQIMNDFRAGKSNILIATSIGEEGIDVGEVDLIVCFDINTSNPTRFVQRIGRTGRQKHGHVIMLVTEGREQKMLREVLANKDQTNKKLLHSPIVQAALYKHSPRLVPTEFDPECVHIHVRPCTPVKKSNEKEKQSTKTKAVVNKTKKPTNSKEKIVANTQDLRQFFKKHNIESDGNDSDDFESSNMQSNSPVQITQRSIDRIERLFKDIQPCYSTNTQLKATQQFCEKSSITSPMTTTIETTRVKLDTQYLKKVNKLLKSSTDAVLPLNDKLLTYLNSPHCSKAAKMFMLKKSYAKVRELCEQMEILQALMVEDVNDMSTHELEIRQTYESIMGLFENRDALQRFLEDAELDELAAKKRQAKKSAALYDWEMTQKDYQYAKQQIFKGLNLQGPSWDSFDYRQEALEQTKAYQLLMLEKNKKKEKQSKTIVNSMVFDAMPNENTYLHCEDLEDMTMNNSLSIVDSKYSSQWETDFQPNRVIKKSTPINSAIAKAFERQKSKQNSARKLLETVKEPAFGSDDDDIIFVPLDVEKKVEDKKLNEDSKSKESTQLGLSTVNLNKPPKALEPSFMQCQQSTPIPEKMKHVVPKQEIIEPSLQAELDLDFEQAFSEPFPEEIALFNKNKVEVLSGSSLKENANPKAKNCESKQSNGTSLFELLESKPVNSILTPKRSLTSTTPKINKTSSVTNELTTQITPKITSNITPQSFNVSGNSTPPTFRSPQKATSVVYCESPKNRPQISTKPNEKSPSIFSTFTKGLQRLESRRNMRAESILGNKNCPSTTAAAENSDIDSPLIRKRKRNFPNVKRQAVEIATEEDGNSPIKLSSHSSNSDDDFEEIKASPKLKRRCLSKQYEKPLRRARFCEFLIGEAEKSGGSGHSEDEEEHDATLGNFVCDSVIVDDDDDNDEEDAPTSTQMQAIYLQSVRSPNERRPGGFKIPAKRNYDINVYSQAVPAEPSHYGLDSFVVHEDEDENAENATLCPLEKAERILKEQRREKRRRCADPETKNPTQKRARKCYQLKDSSDSSDHGEE